MKFEKKTYYRCKTVEEVEEMLRLADKAGYRWCTGESYINSKSLWLKYFNHGYVFNVVSGVVGDTNLSYMTKFKTVNFNNNKRIIESLL